MLEFVRSDRLLAPPAPGEVFHQKMLVDGQLTRAQVARALGVSPARVTMILKGHCQVSIEIALRIERVFGIPAHFWMRVRADYELYQGRQRLSRILAELPEMHHPKEPAKGD